MSAAWIIARVVAGDLDGVELGALQGAVDAGCEAIVIEPQNGHGPVQARVEAAKQAHGALAISIADHESWRGPGRKALEHAREARVGAMHARLLSTWGPDDIPDRIVERLAEWAARHRVATLLVTGPSETSEPGIGALARALVGLVIERAARIKDGPATLLAEEAS
jgi:hypothetical protein